MDCKVRHPRWTYLLSFALLAAPVAVRPDEGRADAHEAVRAALLEAATVPAPPEQGGRTNERWGHEAAHRARHDAEREAHERAGEHGRKHGSEAGADHGLRGGASPHAAPGSAGMDGGFDCHDPAGNERTRDMHDGERDPGGPHHR